MYVVQVYRWGAIGQQVGTKRVGRLVGSVKYGTFHRIIRYESGHAARRERIKPIALALISKCICWGCKEGFWPTKLSAGKGRNRAGDGDTQGYVDRPMGSAPFFRPEPSTTLPLLVSVGEELQVQSSHVFDRHRAVPQFSSA